MGLWQVIGRWNVLHTSKVIFSLPTGLVSDRFARRVIILAGWSIYVSAYVSIIVVSTEWPFRGPR